MTAKLENSSSTEAFIKDNLVKHFSKESMILSTCGQNIPMWFLSEDTELTLEVLPMSLCPGADEDIALT